MIDIKILCFLLGRAMFSMSIMYILPICYALFTNQSEKILSFFVMLMIISAIAATILTYKSTGYRQRIKIIESALTMILVWILLTIFGSIPFMVTNWLSPFEAILETVSDLTAAGLSLLSPDAPYILKLWQASLMWLGSFVFLSILVTILPEVSGCFGLELSLNQGQIFSPMIGQMRSMARKILLIYEVLTLISFIMFKLAGLNNFDSLSMAMRCISTGGGDFFPSRGNVYIEYAARFSMLIACGNFLLYFRLINTIIPPVSSLHLKKIGMKNFAKRIHNLIIEFFMLIKRNCLSNLKIFFNNSEVQFLIVSIFFGTSIILFTTFTKKYIFDGNEAFRLALFHVISYISTTGFNLVDLTNAPDFDRFFLFLIVTIGGCMGSVTGGLKVIRVIILFKLFKIETLKTIHPKMITSIKISGAAVPMKIVGRVLAFFFLCSVTMFLFAIILSLSGQSFSTSVAMSLACLTNTGILPGICDPSDFIALPAVMKLFCCLILIVGRMEIFAFLIVILFAHSNRDRQQW